MYNILRNDDSRTPFHIISSYVQRIMRVWEPHRFLVKTSFFIESLGIKLQMWLNLCISIFLYFMAQQPLVGQGLLIIEASRSQSDTPHSVGLLWPARSRGTTHSTHKRQISMAPAGFEPALQASERPQTYALDGAALGSAKMYLFTYFNISRIMIKAQVPYCVAYSCI
jgi:hypothetical protein